MNEKLLTPKEYLAQPGLFISTPSQVAFSVCVAVLFQSGSILGTSLM
jgi:hypothetical protein